MDKFDTMIIISMLGSIIAICIILGFIGWVIIKLLAFWGVI